MYSDNGVAYISFLKSGDDDDFRPYFKPDGLFTFKLDSKMWAPLHFTFISLSSSIFIQYCFHSKSEAV